LFQRSLTYGDAGDEVGGTEIGGLAKAGDPAGHGPDDTDDELGAGHKPVRVEHAGGALVEDVVLCGGWRRGLARAARRRGLLWSNGRILVKGRFASF